MRSSKVFTVDVVIAAAGSGRRVGAGQNKLLLNLQEEKEVAEALQEKKCIIALGGGSFVNKNVRNKILKDSLSVWLDVNLEILNKRVKWNKKRPLLNVKNSKMEISKIYAERENIYKMANYKINCDNLDKESVVKKIIFFYESQ